MKTPPRASLLLIAASTALVITAGCNRPAAPGANAPGASAPVSTAQRVVVGPPVKKTLSLATSQPGRIEAFEQAPIFAKVSGYVDQIGVDIGDPVKKNGTLLKLAVPEMNDDVKQKEALVAQAEAEVKQAAAAAAAAKAAVPSAEAKVAQAEAGIGRTDAEFARWQAEYDRVKALATSRSVTEKLADETLNQLRSAEAAKKESASAVLAAKALVDEAKSNVDKAEADQATASARLKVAQANLARASTLLSYTEIKSPFDGVVTRRDVDTGHFVGTPGASSQPLLVVCKTDRVRIFVDVPELEAEWVGIGDPAIVTVQALGGRTFDAKVTRLAWSLDPSNRSLRTEVDVPNENGPLRPGMFATVTITLERRADVLTLPAVAVVREGAEAFCCVVTDGKIERRKVELGLRSGPEVEVRSGISADQPVVLVGAAGLKPGQVVEVAAPEKK
jgi:RND family efflux transporter MFP subunit